MASKDELPKDLLPLYRKFPSDVQAKFLELHKKYCFTEAHLDAFELNSNNGEKLSADKVEEFGKHLEAELKKKEKGTPTPARADNGGAKRKMSLVPRGIGDMIGAPRFEVAATMEASTPFPKRQREADELDGTGTPDPISRSVRVTRKTSVNEKLAKPTSDVAAQIRLVGDSALWTGNKPGRAYRWMDEAIEERASAQDAQLISFEGKVLEAVRARPCARLALGEGEDEIAAGTVGVSAQAEVVLCGRLVCEGLEGRLNERSILLEGSSSSRGARVNLNLASCSQLAAFPGQIVGVFGRSGTGSTFHARDFVAGIPPAMPPVAPPATSQAHMMVAAGPFCQRDSLDYSALEQVLEHALSEQPRVLLLLGPFVDANNAKVSSGNTVLPGESNPRPFDEIYTELVLPMLTVGIQKLKRRSATEVLIVPSLDEALCFHPLPQPPLDVSLQLEARAFAQLKPLVKFLPNPAHLEINGMKVSVSSADALSPVLKEIVLRPAERKIEEALRLLLYQRSLFPVLPRDPPQVSEARSAAWQFPFAESSTPDICIFPSQIGSAGGTFVDGTAFINPGVLCKGALGTFAEVVVVPDTSRAAQGGKPLAISERARVDVMKLA
jgi:hypothetical protein